MSSCYLWTDMYRCIADDSSSFAESSSWCVRMGSFGEYHQMVTWWFQQGFTAFLASLWHCRSCGRAESCVTLLCLLSEGMSPCCCGIFLSAYATGDHDLFFLVWAWDWPAWLLSWIRSHLTCISFTARMRNPFYSALLTLGNCHWASVFSPEMLFAQKSHLHQFQYLQDF